MIVPENHKLGADLQTFFKGVRPQIHRKIAEEILRLGPIKFQLAAKAELRLDTEGNQLFTNPIFFHTEGYLERLRDRRGGRQSSPLYPR